jgi:hypothetical protein
MTRSDDDRLDRPDVSEAPARPRPESHPSDFLPGAIGRRLGIEGVPLQREETQARPDCKTPRR